MSSGDRSGGRGGGRGQSEVIGVVLLLSFTVLAAGTIVVVGSSALDSHQLAVDTGNAENELALLGSRAAEVALGDSNVQSVPIDDRDGEYEIREGAGRMVVEHVNRTGNGTAEEIANVSLGSVTYSNGDAKLAFQGGGIWEHDGTNSSLISPPNFYYRDGTLTLPVINVTGDDRTSGLSDAVVRRTTGTQRVFPNAALNYTDPEETPFANPVDNGTVQVTVHSEYYEGWQEYFDDRTEGNTAVDHGNETATVDLITLGDEGETDLEDGRAIRIRGAEGDEPMANFTMTLIGDDQGGINNVVDQWSLTVDGNEVVQLQAKGQGQGGVDVFITNSSDHTYEFEEAFEHDGESVQINLTSDFENEDGDVLGDVFNRTIAEYGPNIDLVVNDPPGGGNDGNRLDYGDSTVYIEYVNRGNFITYLQITENEIEIEFT